MIRSDKKMAIMVTAILLISAFALVMPASAALWQWEQVSDEGFGDLTNDYAWAMATYTPPSDTTEYLYVGTLNTNVSRPFNRTTDGCEVWRTNGTMSGGKYVWEQVVGPNGTQAQAGFSNVTGAPLPTRRIYTRGTRGAVVYNDLLWFGTTGYAGIFVTNGSAWKMANLPFFGTGSGNATYVRSLVEYNGKLHVEAADNTNGAHVFRYNGSENFEDIGTPENIAKWEQVNDNGFDGTNYTASAQLIEFNGDLYACGFGGGLAGSGRGLEIWRTDGTEGPDGKYVWECVVGRTAPFHGPGWDSSNSASLSMVVFQNQLYVGTSDFEGLTAEIWRTRDGVHWECIVPNGFGRPNVYVWRLIEYQGKLIAGTMDPFLGCELWASDTGDRDTWEQINLNGMDLSYSLSANLGLLAKLAPYFGSDLPPIPIPEDLVVPIADQYGVRTVGIYEGYLMVGTASWGDWVDKMLYAVTGGNWTPLSDSVGCEIWRTNGNTYIPLNIGVTKTVWNGTAWVKELNANKSDTVTFRYELRNNGISNLSNITVLDFLSSSLNYSNNATLDNGTTIINREPDFKKSLTKDSYPVGTMLLWDLTDVVLEPDDHITVEYNASVEVKCGIDINFISVMGDFEKYPEAEYGYGCDFAFVHVPYPPPEEIEVTKTVWDPDAGECGEWIEDEFTASMGDTVQFKCVVNNTGTTNLTNITVWDFLSPSLNYSNNSATLDPYFVEEINPDGCTLGTMLLWRIDNLKPNENITICYNASVVKRGADMNFLSATGEFERTETCGYGYDSVIICVPPKMIEVTKSVLVDPINDTWGKRLNASMGDTVRFKYELNNTEEYSLTDITVYDFLSSSLNYSDNATPGREPDVVPCTLGTLLVWDFTDHVLEPGRSITIEYNASVVQCGADINFLFGEGEFNISKDTKEQSFGCDFAMVLVPCPSGDTTDSAANIKDVYYTSETVYATGSGFASNTLVDIYIVDDYAWFNGMNITDRTVYARKYNVSTDEYGNITAVEIWPNPIPGEYDMVFDANQNEIYDVGVDAVDHPNHPGFTVEGQVQVPALTPIGIAALVGVLSIIATSTILRRKRR